MKHKDLYVVTFHPDNLTYELMYMCGLKSTYLTRQFTLESVKNEMVSILQDKDTVIRSVVINDINDYSFSITFDYLDRPEKRYICEYMKTKDTQERKRFCNVFMEMDGFGYFVNGKMVVSRHHSNYSAC